MKRSTWIVLVVACSFFVVGVGLLVGGYAYGLSRGIDWRRPETYGGVVVAGEGVHVNVGPVQVDVDDENDSVRVRIGPFEFGDGGFTGHGWNGDDTGSSSSYGAPKERTLTFDSLEEISLDLVARDVEIVKGNKGSVTLYERYDGEFSEFSVDSGRLRITIANHYGAADSFWNTSNRLQGEQAKVKIVVPEGRAVRLRIDNISGDIDLTDCAFDETSLDLVSGNLEVRRCALGDAEVHNISGEIDMEGTALDRLQADTVSGEVSLTLPEKLERYQVRFSAMSGQLSVNDTDYRVEANIGSGDIRLTINSISGDVEIETDR